MMRKRTQTSVSAAVIAVILLCGPVRAELDKTKYISIDEVKVGMEAYALTVLYGTAIEKFPVKVLSVVRNKEPGSDMILVVVTDERFKNTGAIHGCSGSSVFIDGRLAGALAAGWDGSVEPLYLVRPIEDMLAVGTAPKASASGAATAGRLALDLSGPLDLAAVYEQAAAAMTRQHTGTAMPLATSLPAEVCRSLADSFEMMGVRPLSGAIAGSADGETIDVPIERGGVLAAVLCSGDINLAAVGTVTEVVGEKVYGFGHSFTGIGGVEFPMAAGTVHTVVAGYDYSFKLASPGPVLGTIQFDQNAAISGQIGVSPAMVPMRVTIERYNDPQTRTYNCRLAYDRDYTPMIGRLVASSAATMLGDLPPEHTLRYRGRIAARGQEAIVFENCSSGRSVAEMGMEIFSALTLMLNNPFEQVVPEEIELAIVIEPEDSTAAIWSARLSQAAVKPGQTIAVEVTLQSFRAARTTCTVEVTIPETMPPGKYPLQVMGVAAYTNFVNQNAPHRFRVVDAGTLVAGLNRVMNVPRNRLYAVLPVPSTGLAFRRHELPDLPPTRMMLMQDAKRLEPVVPYNSWVENSVPLEKIVTGGAQIELTVEQP